MSENYKAINTLIQRLKLNIQKVIVGKDEPLRLLIIALLCNGHVLIEDVPGVGKTMLASALARSLQCSFKRIQFTPDVTPSDITGYTFYNMNTGVEKYKEGAIMSHIILADEINRTSPKTQSSLLEVMEERQTTVDGVTRKLPSPFMVLATQNPVDFVGTYPLPEAQMDRFLLKVIMGYPTIQEEIEVLDRYSKPSTPIESLQPVCHVDDIVAMQNMVGTVFCSNEVRAYVAKIAAATRQQTYLELGVSPRGSIALIRASQALALLSGRNFILPDDVRSLAEHVFSHRMVLSAEGRMRGIKVKDILYDILRKIPVPEITK